MDSKNVSNSMAIYTKTSNNGFDLLIGIALVNCNPGVFSYKFNGLIDDVQIYSAALPVAVIQQHYADGLKTHQNLAVK